MKWWKVFLIVSVGALLGMVMGGVFGFIAGHLTPDYFERHSGDWGPVGFAVVLGSKAGAQYGGGLAVFGVIVQTVHQWIKRDVGGTIVPKL